MKNHKRKILAKMVCAVMFATVLAVAVPGNAQTATITVPDNYITIQQAIDAASPGDEVYVRAGTYYEYVAIGKSLTLQGEDRETTIIDGGGTGKVVAVTSTDNVTIRGFTVRNSGNAATYPNEDAGIVLRFVSHTLISDCIITLNKLDGVFGYSASYTTIQNCDISYNDPASGQDGVYRAAIHLRSSLNSTITGNNIYENKGGGVLIRVSGSNATVTGNYVHSNTGGGIHLGFVSNSRVSDNSLHNNGGGIYLDRTTSCTVENNDVYLSGYAISAGFYATNNTIRGNILNQNTSGIYMGGPGVSGNKIYHNDLIENTSQASDAQGGNTWHDGYPSGGNYWSDYTGVDDYSGVDQDVLGSDEIGDTPYDLVNQDKYPLMRPWNILQVAIDIKPQSCPNPLNPKDKGVFPIAILGTEDFDVTTIDPVTLKLEGVSPLRWALEDVATPFDGEECGCTTEGPDGFMDLTLKYKTQELISMLGDVTDGEVRPLYLTGNLMEEFWGTVIEGSDCVVMRVKLKKQSAANLGDLPEEYALFDNFPNPFNPSTTINYSIPEDSYVTLSIYDVLGNEVAQLESGYKSTGNYSYLFDATDLTSGIFFYTIRAGNFIETKKMLLIK